ncbi:MAG TPA: serine/threonine-protein kinase, partial [Chthoniobacterales bacterium]
HYLNEKGPMPPALAVRVAIQVCRALSAAEKEGLVHRDIKPANLMLMENEEGLRVKVIDFGLAKPSSLAGEADATLTIAGFVGTPYFASPEQLGEQDLDIRSDIYSLGVTLWFMLSGRPPFAGTFASLIVQHLHSELPADHLRGVSPPLIEVLKKSLAKNREERFQTPADFRAALQECLPGLPETVVVTAPASLPENLETRLMDTRVPSEAPQSPSAPSYAPGLETRTSGGRPNLLAAGAGLIALAALAIGGALWFTKPKPAAPAAAEATPAPPASPVPVAVALAVSPSATPEASPEASVVPDAGSELEDSLELAKADELSRKIPEAILQYVALIQKYPDDPRAKLRLDLLFQDLSEERSLIADPKPLSPADRAAAETAAETGNARAQLFLGGALRKSEPETAVKWLTLAANQKEPRAMVYLALMTFRGAGGLPRNPRRAIDLLTEANTLGDKEAKPFLGDALLQRTGELAPFYQPARGIEILQESADLGSGLAMYKLGVCYDKGIGVARDEVTAFQWYERAYEQGLIQAAGNLGVCYLKGWGVPKNPSKAVQIFAEGAKSNDPDCLYFYGGCLMDGLGTAKNLPLGKSYLAKAAALGHSNAIAACRERNIPFASTPDPAQP